MIELILFDLCLYPIPTYQPYEYQKDMSVDLAADEALARRLQAEEDGRPFSLTESGDRGGGARNELSPLMQRQAMEQGG